MKTINVSDAQTHLVDIIAEMIPGEPVTITKNGEAIAILSRTERTSWPCKAGSAKDTRHWMASDFDAPLDDFREYME